MGVKGIGLGAMAAAMLAWPAAGAAATHDVAAAGNPVSGGLRFDPAQLRIAVGDTVRWTNTDGFAPHTATHSNGLFQLTGDYGGTPANPPGFGPGQSRERVFESGTFRYFCEVHPAQMRGVISVPPTVRRLGDGRVRVTWATKPAPEGEVFDVKRRVGGKFKLVRRGTERTGATFAGGGEFKVRVRSAGDADAASEYSPVARAPR